MRGKLDDDMEAVLATAAADLALTLHVEYKTVRDHRQAVVEQLYNFGLAFCWLASHGAFGTDPSEYMLGTNNESSRIL